MPDKDRIKLTSDPPFELAIDIDITSRTHNYESQGVPELWLTNGKTLEILRRQDGR